MSEDESPGDMSDVESPGDISDDAMPELVVIPRWPNFGAIGNQGKDHPGPLLPQHWVAFVPGTGLFDSLASNRFLVTQRFLQDEMNRFHQQNHTFCSSAG